MKVALILIMCFLAYFSIGFGSMILLVLTDLLDPDDANDASLMVMTVLFWPIVISVAVVMFVIEGIDDALVSVGRKIKENKRNGSD